MNIESAFLVAAIIGFIECEKCLANHDYESAIIIVGSAGIGAAVGIAGIDHMTVITGLQAGLAAAGTYRIGKVVSGK